MEVAIQSIRSVQILDCCTTLDFYWLSFVSVEFISNLYCLLQVTLFVKLVRSVNSEHKSCTLPQQSGIWKDVKLAHTHTNTHKYIYIYIYKYVYVCIWIHRSLFLIKFFSDWFGWFLLSIRENIDNIG